MDISSIAVNSSVYGVLPTKTSDCFTVSIGKRKNSNNNKFLFGFSNRSSRNLKIQAVHLDEVTIISYVVLFPSKKCISPNFLTHWVIKCFILQA